MNNKLLIVSNNEKVIKRYSNYLKVEGLYIDVLIKVRDLINKGYTLVSHPLPASIRMFYSPVKSIILKGESDTDLEFKFDYKSIELIENAIENYKKTMGIRVPDEKNLSDYEKIDLKLLESAIEELSMLDERVKSV